MLPITMGCEFMPTAHFIFVLDFLNLSLTYWIVSFSFPSIVPANGPVFCVIMTV